MYILANSWCEERLYIHIWIETIITDKVWGTLILLKLEIEGWPRFLMREKQCFLLMCIQRIMLRPKQ